VLEAKVAPKDPDSDEEDEKITLLNNFNFTSSYNIAADSLRWSPVTMSAGTRLLKDKLAINFNGSLDPYQVNDNGIRINRFNPNIFRLTRANLTANYSISSKDLEKNKDDKKKVKSTNGNQDVGDIIGADINPTDQFGQRKNINTAPEDQNKEAQLFRAKVPWSINLAYSASYNNNGVDPGEIGIHSLMFSGNLERCKIYCVSRFKMG